MVSFLPRTNPVISETGRGEGEGEASGCYTCLHYSKCNVPVIISQEVSMVHMIHQDNHSPQEEVLLKV